MYARTVPEYEEAMQLDCLLKVTAAAVTGRGMGDARKQSVDKNRSRSHDRSWCGVVMPQSGATKALPYIIRRKVKATLDGIQRKVCLYRRPDLQIMRVVLCASISVDL